MAKQVKAALVVVVMELAAMAGEVEIMAHLLASQVAATAVVVRAMVVMVAAAAAAVQVVYALRVSRTRHCPAKVAD